MSNCVDDDLESHLIIFPIVRQVSHSSGEEASLSTSGFVQEVLQSLDDSDREQQARPAEFNVQQQAQQTEYNVHIGGAAQHIHSQVSCIWLHF